MFLKEDDAIEITAKTGEKCTQGGLWYPKGKPNETRAIGITNIMPPIKNGDTWVLGTPSGTGK